jgi:hypothetical protein
VVPLAEKPDFNGNRRHTFIPVFLLAEPTPQRLHSVLQSLALTQTHAEPYENPDSFAQPHRHPFLQPDSDSFSHTFVPVCLLADPHGNSHTPHLFHLPGDRCR